MISRVTDRRCFIHKTCAASIEREMMRKKMDLDCFKVLSRHSVKRLRKITEPQLKVFSNTVEIVSLNSDISSVDIIVFWHVRGFFRASSF
jgi:hypothetical protein